ncbi:MULTISPECIES: hybrid-cluster NAD(P)-dependent oxidoreductase [Burkholderia]|uniref:hybrid-cluster NAD(P)-dependent oxidoreductase n=1 Tax=Burkholderia TaxID=32008 RepID=UPI00075C76B1|nr:MULTISPECIES: hybrid-cluster NAD(P)-dependent oxidoreductase [Burkholderia]AOJ72032.1 hybrid-cluster NAD(P)-dependent oxidoreductase [Burkholderia savannae]KVG49741.1 hybrid-cluster NAD(P)-dependent oxidoreductase [Burkholderia sp. MSMB0265]KVG82879.1 hybrid-cluster NAD(P)-dependent oxidoreductase [Burkholderia sp. MSMB2040]KVG93528.1 hybrid-cluster NAD(P)-dependent oxidoreductase [Burkholderia sp. MSMB2041]KVG97956.1 hybrid-cluster NAD(P)-dependent oxidoreductase [Burkholderia sp. MSMB2042
MMRDAANFEPADSRVTRPAFWQALPERWTSDVEETLVCCHVRQETHDVKSFFFRSPQGRAFSFEPGQFVTLELDIDGETINRCYTISSSPARPHTISITVKRVPGGKVSNWLHDNLQPGAPLRVLGPAGEFTCARHPARKYLFLSAGSGVTPLMSMSRAHHDLAEDRDIVFVHSARTPDDIIFARELDLIASTHANFRAAFVCERLGARTNWHGVTGFLSLPLLKLITPDFFEREVFTCGPAPYMKAVREMLDEAGFDLSRYHEESFSFETLAENGARTLDGEAASTDTSSDASSDAQARQFTVAFAKSNREIACGSDQHVLDAARRAGVRLPASCTQGMCGTCKVKLVSGQVDMKHNGGIRQREIDQGMVLLCCSKPLSDLVVDK